MLRFRFLGIPYEIHPMFWVFSAILGSNQAQGDDALLLLAVWVACAFVSIVIHEAGHALAARRYGAEPRVALYQMGGLTSFAGAAFTRWQFLAIILAGPLAGFATYCVVGTAGPFIQRSLLGSAYMEAHPSVELAVTQALEFLMFTNFWWTIYNLLPIRPLDGGQALGTILGPRNTELTRWIGVAVAVGVCVWAVMHHQPYMALFIGYLAYSNFQGNTRALPGAPGR